MLEALHFLSSLSDLSWSLQNGENLPQRLIKIFIILSKLWDFFNIKSKGLSDM